MKDRLKQIRAAVGAQEKANGKPLTQQEFADRLGLKYNTIATYETGRQEPSDRTIADICRVYDVNEIWLRTGVGEMFRPRTREEEITDFLADVLRDQPEALRKRLVLSLSRLTPEQWDLLDQLLDQIMEDIKKDRPDG